MHRSSRRLVVLIGGVLIATLLGQGAALPGNASVVPKALVRPHTLTMQMIPGPTAAGADFGAASSIEGHYGAVGASFEYSRTLSLANSSSPLDPGQPGTQGEVCVIASNSAGTSFITKDRKCIRDPDGGAKWPNDRFGLDQFGYSVAVSGATMAVGAPGKAASTLLHASALCGMNKFYGATLLTASVSGVGCGAGEVYLYSLPITTGVPLCKIPAPFDVSGGRFGDDVAIYQGTSSTLLVVGAYPSATVDTVQPNDQGEVWVYKFPNGTCPSSADRRALPSLTPPSDFGYSVAVSSSDVVVGTVSQGVRWWKTSSLFPTPPAGNALNDPQGMGCCEFGNELAFSYDGAQLAVGAWGTPSGTSAHAGAAYLYEFTSGTPVLSPAGELLDSKAPGAATAPQFDQFGTDVAVTHVRLLVTRGGSAGRQPLFGFENISSPWGSPATYWPPIGHDGVLTVSADDADAIGGNPVGTSSGFAFLIEFV